jgi:hypothetical protein
VRNFGDISTQMLVSAIFWDAFCAGSAVTALLQIGFADTDVDAVGVLTGRAPDVSGFLTSMGVPRMDAAYCNDCFRDGAVLLLVRVQPWEQRIALEVLCRHGGMLPPSCQIHDHHSPVGGNEASRVER